MGFCANSKTKNQSCINSDACSKNNCGDDNKKLTLLVVKNKAGQVTETFEMNTETPLVAPEMFEANKGTDDGPLLAPKMFGEDSPSIIL